MAQKTLVQLIDDLDGTPVADGEGRTAFFTLNGPSYEIDLSDAHADELAAVLAPYIENGRRPSRNGTRATGTAKSDRAELQKIREWAKANGHEVSDRGRVSGAICDAYNAAH